MLRGIRLVASMTKSLCPIPDITDADIAWVADLMHLDLDDERKHFLKCNTSIDVAACPGSGKTTLVVAKLAILAKKWPHQTKGICVLSHTNVAREEIETRLSNVPNGHSLLNYPNFIGTIHAFANRFLASPYLKSQGYGDIIIDDSLTHEYRKHSLGSAFYGLDQFLIKKHSAFERLRLTGTNFTFSLNGNDFPAGSHTESFKSAQKAVQKSAENGYFCYDEMFVWARAMLDKSEQLCAWLSERFPIVIIDEVQDTNQEQGDLLRRIFPPSSSVIMQRVGDDNQAIFNHAGDTEDAALGFPQKGHHTLSRSFRFGQEIANFAAPFAISPVRPRLTGQGPQKHTECIKNHTIFIFPQKDTSKVLQSFGELVLKTFSDEQLALRHRVTAIGAVHKREEGDCSPKHHPKSVGHYWQGYSSKNGAKKEHPETLLQYFTSAQDIAQAEDCIANAANKIASGIIRMVKISGNKIESKGSAHRTLMTLLSENSNAHNSAKKYQEVLLTYLLGNNKIDTNNWKNIKIELQSILLPVFPDGINFCGENPFLNGPTNTCTQPSLVSTAKRANVCVVEKGGRQVEIHLDSIHGVKGQTHLATLLLETFNRSHFFKQLLDCLIDKKCNDTASNPRLKQAYVAMTRPTHLLCLAIPDSSLNKNGKFEEHINCLQRKGWQIQSLLE